MGRMKKFSTIEVGVSVIKRDGEDIESLLRRFKKKVNNSGILKDLKEKSHYEKPCIQRKKKRLEAKKRLIREQIKIEKRLRRKERGIKKDDSGTK